MLRLESSEKAKNALLRGLIQLNLLILPFVLSQSAVPFLSLNSSISGTLVSFDLDKQVREERQVILSKQTEALENFFDKHNSPLKEDSKTFVLVAEKYDLDWKLLPSIACKESACGKLIPYTFAGNPSYNPFGWGIYGDNVLSFPTWGDAIEEVGKGLKEGYIDQGLDTPEEIQYVYAPPSVGTWSTGVQYFMEQIEHSEPN